MPSTNLLPEANASVGLIDGTTTIGVVVVVVCLVQLAQLWTWSMTAQPGQP